MSDFVAPMIIRGEVIGERLVQFSGREDGISFSAPDPHVYAERLPLGAPSRLADLQKLSFGDILDYLERLGDRLRLDDNPHLQRAYEATVLTSPHTPPLIRVQYEAIPATLRNREWLTRIADESIGLAHMEGWVEHTSYTGHRVKVRAFGARTLHVVPGNAPMASVWTIIRNALMRSDAIIKAPSNDPLTAAAVGQTMCEMAPDHPITKHLAVAYWKGGDTELEQYLFQPHNIEKIIAWGGFSSVKHVTRYIQPGLELIALDPKRSVSIIGPEAFASESSLQEVALRLATDIGAFNQKGCVCARVAYVVSGTHDAGIAQLEDLGRRVFAAMQALPESLSTPAKFVSRELRTHLDTLRLDDEWYTLIGGEGNEGAIIVSKLPSPVDFAEHLDDRVANLVPVDSVDEVIEVVNAYTQTVGVYPETLKAPLVNVLPLYGAQRICSLGYAAHMAHAAQHDAIEPMRRMVKWIIDEVADPRSVTPLWEAPHL